MLKEGIITLNTSLVYATGQYSVKYVIRAIPNIKS